MCCMVLYFTLLYFTLISWSKIKPKLHGPNFKYKAKLVYLPIPKTTTFNIIGSQLGIAKLVLSKKKVYPYQAMLHSFYSCNILKHLEMLTNKWGKHNNIKGNTIFKECKTILETDKIIKEYILYKCTL